MSLRDWTACLGNRARLNTFYRDIQERKKKILSQGKSAEERTVLTGLGARTELVDTPTGLGSVPTGLDGMPTEPGGAKHFLSINPRSQKRSGLEPRKMAGERTDRSSRACRHPYGARQCPHGTGHSYGAGQLPYGAGWHVYGTGCGQSLYVTGAIGLAAASGMLRFSWVVMAPCGLAIFKKLTTRA